MNLRRLCKAATSYPDHDCPAVYVDDAQEATANGSPEMMVCQVKTIDASTTAQLQDLADDEVAGAMPAETVPRAAGLYMAERGHTGVLDEVEAYLATVTR